MNFLRQHGAGLILAIAGIAVVGYWAGRREERIRQDTASWVHRAQVALQRGDSLQKVSDSLQAREVAITARLAATRRRVDTLWLAAESVLTHDTNVVHAVPILIQALQECRQGFAEADSALVLCRARGDVQRQRGDSLARLLALGIPKVDCHWLRIGFLPRCASRTMSFFGGARLRRLGQLLRRP